MKENIDKDYMEALQRMGDNWDDQDEAKGGDPERAQQRAGMKELDSPLNSEEFRTQTKEPQGSHQKDAVEISFPL